MKLAIFHRTKLKDEYIEKIQKKGFKYSENNPEIAISMGGDGTYLRSERKWPGIPKVIIKDSKICKKCETEDLEETLEKIKEKDYRIKENIKLETKIKRRKITCVNEFSIRNRYATTALRFYVWVDDEMMGEIIGDGVIISTPFGSSAYYKSAGGEEFKKGIGIVFNNPTEEMKPMIVDENSTIKVKIMRGDPVFNADNNPKVILLKAGDSIKIQKSENKIKLVDI